MAQTKVKIKDQKGAANYGLGEIAEGDTVEVADFLARSMVEAGYAEEVKAKKK
jgi:hypothetical protein